MNAISLYVSTSRLVLQNDGNSNWSDLYRLVPYLRQSLSCKSCDQLLIEPFSPLANCQHNLCKLCVGEKRNLKVTCVWCCDKQNYEENIQLRILLQCYKSLCEHITLTPIFQEMRNKTCIINNKNEKTTSLIDLIEEGARFQDDYKSRSGLTKSAYSILPCVYTNSSTQTLNSAPNYIASNIESECEKVPDVVPDVKSVSNSSSVYSVLYAESGNKITIKRKTESESNNLTNVNLIPTNFKKPSSSKQQKTIAKRKGCRCGNATLTPGKLTCCGQRCPCYVASKSCIECKCKGCRNPHRPNGFKVRPHIQMPTVVHNNQLNIEHSTKNRDDQRNCLQLTLLNGNTQNHCNQISLNNTLIYNTTEIQTTTTTTNNNNNSNNNSSNNLQGTEISINL